MKSNKEQSITDRIEPYAGEWVALTADQTTILAHSRNLKSALKQAHKNGEKFPHMIKAPNGATASIIYWTKYLLFLIKEFTSLREETFPLKLNMFLLSRLFKKIGQIVSIFLLILLLILERTTVFFQPNWENWLGWM